MRLVSAGLLGFSFSITRKVTLLKLRNVSLDFSFLLFLNCLMKEFRQISFFPTIPAWLLNPDQTSRRKSFEQAAERRRADCYSEKFVFVPSVVVWLSGRADEPNRTTSPPGSNKSLRRRREAPVYLLQLLGALLSSADLTGNKCWGSLFFCRDTRERKPSLK